METRKLEHLTKTGKPKQRSGKWVLQCPGYYYFEDDWGYVLIHDCWRNRWEFKNIRNAWHPIAAFDKFAEAKAFAEKRIAAFVKLDEAKEQLETLERANDGKNNQFITGATPEA